MIIQRRTLVQSAPIEMEIPSLLDRLYRQRGVTDAAQVQTKAKFLRHFDELRGIEKAAELIADAVIKAKKITIVGDFDADGATSTALCMLSLKQFAHTDMDYLVPNRFDFGYGLSPEIVELAAKQGAELIITVDNGISCIAGVARAKALGMQVVVTDHHLPAEKLPEADAIVNPNQPGCEFLSKNLAGVGVAFYVMSAVKKQLETKQWFVQQGLAVPNLAVFLDIVAIGTVADVVCLDENNRILVHQGLQRIRSGVTRPGIKALLEVASRPYQRLGASDLGFVIGPRLNAAGRLDDMALGIECLLTEDSYQARQMALQLDQLNQQRRSIEASMQQDALHSLEGIQLDDQNMPSGLVIYQADFHQGVIGILAGRLKEKYFRPTIVFAKQDENEIKGSARSIPGIHIRDVLESINAKHPGMIIKFGGHAMAAGLSLQTCQITPFKLAFEQACDTALQGLPKQQVILSDGALLSHEINIENASLLKLAMPWGQGFEEPLFDDVFVLHAQRIVGKNHLKMVVSIDNTEFDAIAFNVDTEIWPNPQANKVHLAYKLDVNEYRGKVSVQLLVDDLVAITS